MKNGTLLESEKRTATTSSVDQATGASERGVTIALDITKAPNTAAKLTPQLEFKDPASGKYVPITAFAATKEGKELAAGTTLLFTVYPGGLETAAVNNHEVQGLPLPSNWRVKVTHSNEDEWTYSVGISPLN